MTDDPYEYLRSLIGDPVAELAQTIHDEMQTTADPEPTFLEERTARAVFDWHRVRVLDLEHLLTEAQNWHSANAFTVLPDWGALRQILLGDRLDDR